MRYEVWRSMLLPQGHVHAEKLRERECKNQGIHNYSPSSLSYVFVALYSRTCAKKIQRRRVTTMNKNN